MKRPRFIVVGAGLSGLVCARTLADSGVEVLVLDKGRAPGGRASTRREPGGRTFDHGAQFFTARGEWLARNVAQWEREGVVARWSPRASPAPGGRSGPRSGETWWVGTPGMGSLAHHLARGLDVRTSSAVTSLAHRSGAWTVEVAGVAHEAAGVVLALPAVQCVRLLGDASPVASAVAAEELDPCWSAMVAIGDPTEPARPFDLIERDDGPLAWAAREASKPGRVAREGEALWTVHASAAWSRAHLDDELEAVAAALSGALLAELAPLGMAGDLRHANAHRWRFARARTATHRGCFFDPARMLALCGDWLESPRIEGALTSGVAAATRVLAALDVGR